MAIVLPSAPNTFVHLNKIANNCELNTNKGLEIK
ncbi:hypothetical protein EYZ11_007043 [Aspergillus tanneri]|uniref:Uncharacterized protein n=1 Tax=Aspergillus tanneri TaxID=1220188 RepID=A0A4S3JG90_9EURO|nr:hypothetical protein EYZ11_007043 [Aspergillus tanneri]